MNSRDRTNWLSLAVAGLGACLVGRQIVRHARRFDLSNRLVLITGGSRGLGFLLAKEFLNAGARVAICARDADELERARRQLGSGGREVWIGVCDVSVESSITDLISRLTADAGPIDVLVNNVGTIEVGPIETMTIDDYRRAMDVNFWSAVLMTSSVIGSMRTRKRGRIVNISSVGGKLAIPHLLPYSASKFALAGWSTGLRAEAKKDNIFVSTIYPGLIRTGSPRNAQFKGQHRKEYAWFAIGDASPFTSMSATRAARRIVAACINGEAEVVLSWQAKLAATFCRDRAGDNV